VGRSLICPASRKRRADLGRFAGASAGRNPNSGGDADLAVGRIPALAHLGLHLFGIERLAESLGHGGAEQITLGRLDLAGDEFAAESLLVRLEVRQLGFQGAEPIDDRAGGEVVEWGNGRD
jgi:hypothetical protein